MLRIAMVGVGDVASSDYLPEFHRIVDCAELVAVCGRGPARARAVGESVGVEWFTDIDKLLSDVDPDAVLNLTPIQAHLEVSIKTLQAGKHLYSEKPIAQTAAEAAELRDLASKAGVVFVAAPCVLLFPQLILVRQLLEEGVIGDIHGARGVMLAGVPPWPGYTSDPSQFFSPGGGPLIDMGIYAIHAITGLLGPATRVTAVSMRVRNEFVVEDGDHAGKRVAVEVDDHWTVILQLGSATVASIEANFATAGSAAPGLELLGSRGAITVDPLDVSAPVKVMNADGDWRTVNVPNSGRAAGPDHILGVEHLVHCVTTGAKPIPSPDHAIHCIEILEASAKSATSGRAIEVGSNTRHWEPSTKGEGNE